GIELTAMELLAGWGLAMVDRADGAPSAAAARCHAILERWQQTEERHYVVPAFRWATTFFVEQGGGAGAGPSAGNGAVAPAGRRPSGCWPRRSTSIWCHPRTGSAP